MTKNNLFNIIDNNNIQENIVLREKKAWDYNIPYKCIVVNAYTRENFIIIEVGISLTDSDEDFQVESFPFSINGTARRFFDRFIDTAFPDKEELKVGDIIGKSFIGEIVDRNGYTNIQAIGPCDNPIVDDGFRPSDTETQAFI